MSEELRWGFPIALYLFVGGMSAAAYYVGVFADLIGKDRYKEVARIGSYIVLIPIIIGLLMLVVDLGRPLRFWHLMLQLGPVNTGIIIRPGSVMSLGTWFLVAFSAVCGVAYPLMWLAKERFASNIPVLSALAEKDDIRRAVGVLGLPIAFLVAIYTGVLLAVSSRPIWADTVLLPVLFVISATSTGIAAIILLLSLSKSGAHHEVRRLEKGDNFMIKLELVFVAILAIALFISPRAIGAIKNVMVGDFAVFFWLGFIAAGLLIPFNIQRFGLQNSSLSTKGLAVTSSVLVLLGGFFLRFIVLIAA
ncbi:MAG: polysulfide reductase NrfD [Firmicutes bacterium]|nr:polysulfide reductase NrfD [Bacillota bacterium]